MDDDPLTPGGRAPERADASRTARRWMDEHGDVLFHFALSRLPGRQQAEDAVQECLIAALSAYKEFRGDSAERTWLLGILKHKVMDYYRMSGRELLVEDENEADALFMAFFERNGSWREQPTAWHSPDSDLERAEF